MRYALTLSYDGIGFCGWQIQPSEPSVQAALQQALTILLGCETAVTGAGRTDTDVHALQYVAHFDYEGPLPNESKDFLYKLNAILPSGVAVFSISEVADGFHARFDACRRTYLYFIHFRKDPFVERYSWHCKFPLDVEKMNEACRYLLGTHDFSCFEKKGADSKTAICTISEARWEWYQPTLWEMSCGGGTGCGHVAEPGPYLVFRISADRFLRNMVRAIVGTMVEVGRGRLSPEDLPAILDSKDRCRAGQSVPGNALFLASVEY
ncbi:MAG: tRNA pseudouridine(38-40) synthase TruA [Bacteroidales bacterium]|nr:tRNA pseudouridine(38-40) synthase TruA [Bacteroidales bacterium]